MGETNSLTIIKTEAINDDDDLDCYGNYDKREKTTCGKCGLATQCAVTTEQLQKQKFNFRPTLKSEINSVKKKLKESNEVIALVRKIKTKQKEVEKTMGEIKKLKKKSSDGEVKSVKKVSSGDTEKKKIVKPSGEKTAGRPRVRELVETIGETTLPVAFKPLYKGLKELGEFKNKKSISNVSSDNGTFCAISQIGRTAEKVEVFLNRSRGYAVKVGKYTETKTEGKSNSALLVVTSSDKSQNEALEILAKWKKDQVKHVSENSAPRGRKKGEKSEKSEKSSGKVVKKTSDGDEKKKVKVVKKDKSEKTEVKSEKKAEKKSPPVVKPVKKAAPKVEDEEG